MNFARVHYVVLCLLAGWAIAVFGGEKAGPDGIGKLAASDWHGYAKQSFALEGCACFVVEPKTAAPGKPWVWRTSFPDYHPEVDLELLRGGWHVGYIHCLEMLGADCSLDLMDKFYDAARRKWGLAEKPALEAVSRGGLHAYRYAARHPDRIACIYADTPVMDLESWPLQWPGSRRSARTEHAGGQTPAGHARPRHGNRDCRRGREGKQRPSLHLAGGRRLGPVCYEARPGPALLTGNSAGATMWR